MIHQILKAFFLGQILAESLYENTVVQWRNEFEKISEQKKSKNGKFTESNGDHRVESVFSESKQDYEQLIQLAQKLLTNSFILVQEYSRHIVFRIVGEVAMATECAMEAAKIPVPWTFQSGHKDKAASETVNESAVA